MQQFNNIIVKVQTLLYIIISEACFRCKSYKNSEKNYYMYYRYTYYYTILIILLWYILHRLLSNNQQSASYIDYTCKVLWVTLLDALWVAQWVALLLSLRVALILWMVLWVSHAGSLQSFSLLSFRRFFGRGDLSTVLGTVLGVTWSSCCSCRLCTGLRTDRLHTRPSSILTPSANRTIDIVDAIWIIML